MANYEKMVGQIDLKVCFLTSGDQDASFGTRQAWSTNKMRIFSFYHLKKRAWSKKVGGGQNQNCHLRKSFYLTFELMIPAVKLLAAIKSHASHIHDISSLTITLFVYV